MLYSVTVCFLIFSATSFTALFKYSSQMFDVIFGGDLNIFSVQKGQMPTIPEMKLRNALEALTVENGGKVEAYTFPTARMRRQYY